jgi:hypothetical protein
MIPVVVDKSFWPRSAGGTGGRIQTKLELRIKKGFFDQARVKRMLDAANQRGLEKAADRIWEAAKRGIGRAPKRTKKWERAAGVNDLVEIRGGLYRDVTQANSGQPRPPGQPVKSWGPKRLLYKSLRRYYQHSSRSAIIGPAFIPWLVQLHEFGGNLTMRAYGLATKQARIAKRQRDQAGRSGGGRDTRGRFTKGKRRDGIATFANGMPKTGVLLWSSRAIRTGRLWTDLHMRRRAHYPARPYMGSQAVQTAKAKIAAQFRDTIRGPGI